MNIAFFIGEMNYRGVVNSTFQFALKNRINLKNKSIIFYDKTNVLNNKEVIKKFKKKFKTIPITNFLEIENFKVKYNIDYIYIQKGGERDNFYSKKIKTLVHALYPQKINQIHGYRYVYASEWLSKNFSNYKIPYVPYMVEMHQTKKNLRKIFNIKKKQVVLGCHGGESSFNLKFAQDVIKKILESRTDITFLFLNINKFCKHKRAIFLKGTIEENYKKKFLNTCDAMIYGRSLGESFGLACAEFATLDKPIISYKFNRHKNHKLSLSKKKFYEYGSYSDLYNILMNYKIKSNLKIRNKYKNCKPNQVTEKFRKIFLSKDKKKIFFNIEDYLINSLGFLKMNYFYLRHKIYSFYYIFFVSKFNN